MSLDALVDEVRRRAEDLHRADALSGRRLFTRDLLRRLALLPQELYEKFRFELDLALVDSGIVRVPGMSWTWVDRLVEGARRSLEEEFRTRPRRLGDLLPDAPDPDLLVSAGWHLDADGLYVADGSGKPAAKFAESPVYLAARSFDRERVRETRVLAFRRDGEWTYLQVPADATDKQVARALEGAGVAVFSRADLARYLKDFLLLNGAVLARSGAADTDSVFDRWCDHVEAHADRFFYGALGWLTTAEGRRCLAVKPEVLERFLQKQRVPYRSTLAAWARAGLLLADGTSVLRVVYRRGRARRMAVFPLDALGVEEPRKDNGGADGGASPGSGGADESCRGE